MRERERESWCKRVAWQQREREFLCYWEWARQNVGEIGESEADISDKNWIITGLTLTDKREQRKFHFLLWQKAIFKFLRFSTWLQKFSLSQFFQLWLKNCLIFATSVLCDDKVTSEAFFQWMILWKMQLKQMDKNKNSLIILQRRPTPSKTKPLSERTCVNHSYSFLLYVFYYQRSPWNLSILWWR